MEICQTIQKYREILLGEEELIASSMEEELKYRQKIRDLEENIEICINRQRDQNTIINAYKSAISGLENENRRVRPTV